MIKLCRRSYLIYFWNLHSIIRIHCQLDVHSILEGSLEINLKENPPRRSQDSLLFEMWKHLRRNQWKCPWHDCYKWRFLKCCVEESQSSSTKDRRAFHRRSRVIFIEIILRRDKLGGWKSYLDIWRILYIDCRLHVANVHSWFIESTMSRFWPFSSILLLPSVVNENAAFLRAGIFLDSWENNFPVEKIKKENFSPAMY